LCVGDLVVDAAGGVVVVAGHVGERPRISVVGAGGGVGGAALVEAGQHGGAVDALAAAARRVGRAVVGDGVAGDRGAVGVGLVDLVVDAAGGVVVVAGHVGERPRISVVGARRRVRRAGKIKAAEVGRPVDAQAVAGRGVWV